MIGCCLTRKKSTNMKSMKSLIKAFFATVIAVSGVNALAQNAYTPGNLVIDRIGNGSTALTSASAPIFLDQYTTAGVFVSSNAVPTSGASELVDAGNSTLEGELTLSPDGTKLVFVGYNVASGISSIAGTLSSSDQRAAATVDYNGNYILQVEDPYAFDTFSIRSGTTDGSGHFWGAGAGIGVFYLTGTSNNISTTEVNNRYIEEIGGNIYYSTGSGTGIYKISGTPTSGLNTATKVLTDPGSPYGFAFDPIMDTCYVADTESFTSPSSVGDGGIEKYTWNGTAWAYQYSIAPPPGFAPANVTNAVYFVAVNWTTMPPTIYGLTTITTNTITPTNIVFAVQDTGPTAVAVPIATNAPNEIFRGISLAPSSGAPAASAPVITGITPFGAGGLVTNNGGSSLTFRLNGTTGSPIASNNWYIISGGVTNQIIGANMDSLTLPSLAPVNQASYFAILTNASGAATSSVVSLTVIANPGITGISPASDTVGAGATVSYALTSSSGYPPASNLWFKVTTVGPTTVTNLILNGTQSSGSTAYGANSTTLTLSNVLGGDAASYFAELTNIYGSATSAVVTLAVTNDPVIQIEPNYTYGLVDGVAQFSVTAVGSNPINYQWYFVDANSNVVAAVNPGSTTASGAVIYGAGTSLLSISNIQTADLTNFIVVISNLYGSETSSVAGVLAVTNIYAFDYPSPYYGYLPPVTPIALWDFNGSAFTNALVYPNATTNPAPYLGVGTASAVGSCYEVGSSPFSGSDDPNDGPTVDQLVPSLGVHEPDFSWGTLNYPASGTNKQSGVQFNVSTVGAKNILFEYDSRVSATASDYERVQYTTNGTTWIDYPSSSSFDGIATTYETYTNDLTGFPGVNNNPNFGVRVVAEVQGTATYGVSGTTNYLGTANNYGSGGTVTYDLVGIYGDAITNNNQPPVISAFTNAATGFQVTNTQTTLDNLPLTNNFFVSGDATANKFTYSAVSLDPSQTVNPTFNFTSNAMGGCTMIIIPNSIEVPIAAAPILVTVTDVNGDSTKAWFDLTLTTAYQPPTNTLTLLAGTNILANSSVTIPFMVGSQSNAISQLSYETNSYNNTVLPATNIQIIGQGTANPSVVYTAGSNELGVALVTVTVNDNNPSDAKFTTATNAIMVIPNTNVIFVDYFNYDNTATLPLDEIGGFWQHLTGTTHTILETSSPTGGYVKVNTKSNTENMQVPLLGGPYPTNAGAAIGTLYYSLIVNKETIDTPNSNGTYFACLNTGVPQATTNVEGLLLIVTNNALPGDYGDYQIGVGNDNGDMIQSNGTVNANFNSIAIFPQDLVPGSNYAVVVALNLSNAVSTVWVDPSSQSSLSVTAPIDFGTVAYPIADFELRQSGNEEGAIAGTIDVSYIKVGTTFDSVFPSLHVTPAGTNVVINWSDPTLGIQSTTNLQTTPFTDVPGGSPPYTNNASTNGYMFFKFGR